jgi:hypothetical protein
VLNLRLIAALANRLAAEFQAEADRIETDELAELQ